MARRISVWSGVAALAVAGILAWFAPLTSERSTLQSDYTVRWNALLSDPFILRVLAENEEKCSDEYVYVWAGGVTLRLKRPSGYLRCSAPETPWFAGTLTNPAKSGEYRQWSWPSVATFYLSGDTGCRAENCASLSILGGPNDARSLYALRQKPPTSLPEEPVWPDFENRATYGTWQEGGWAKFQGTTVRFHFGQGIFDLRGYRPPVYMLLQHPRYPVMMGVGLPPDQREYWRVHLQAAVDLIDDAIIGSIKLDSDQEPPITVRFVAEKFNGSIEFLKDWRDSRTKNQ